MTAAPDKLAGRIDPAARAALIIDLDAIAANYRKLRDCQAPGECAGVVKANAYGMGLEPVARALWREGCRTFFVATVAEGLKLRSLLGKAVIYVLDGLIGADGKHFSQHDLRPVLGSIREVEFWADHCTAQSRQLPAAIHIDTGMNRLGLSPDEVPRLAAKTALLDKFKLALIMTHLVSGEIRDDPLTRQQADLFDHLRKLLPPAPTSFGNSAGTLLCASRNDTRLHHDLARPGVALYGAQVFIDTDNPMQPVTTLLARVLKVRNVGSGETVGYNATWRANKPVRIATLATGYADGYLRALSSTNDNPGLPVYFGDYPAQLVGRVSMDYITVDVTDIPEAYCHQGKFAELLGPHVSVDDMAARARTNAYEILTGLANQRAQRIYLGLDQV